MGIDILGVEAICKSLKYVKNKGALLTLGRQGVYMPTTQIDSILNKNGININYKSNTPFSEKLFSDLGFKILDSIDFSSYEDATILHNMNMPIPKSMKSYNYIFDGGTTEHIFNIPQVYENIIDLLDIGGIFCSVIPNNNMSGHGMYQFSPEFFLSSLNKKYGMEILEIYLAEVGSYSNTWINVNTNNKEGGGRNCSKFNSLNEVCIITIAKKVSNLRESLIQNPPNQFSYETFDWKQKS